MICSDHYRIIVIYKKCQSFSCFLVIFQHLNVFGKFMHTHTTQRHPEEIQMTSYVGCSEIQRTYGTFQHTSCGLQLEVKISRFYSSCGRQSYDTLRIFKDLRTTVVGCLLELNDALRMRLGCIQEFVGSF